MLNKKIKPFMTFGKMPIANNFLTEKEFKNEYFFEMDVAFDEEYSLFKLNNFPAPEKMFNENYKFFSSTSKYMELHFKNFYSNLLKFQSNEPTKVIEIGCNDGIMLKNFKINNLEHLGFEPSKNVAEIARSKGLNITNSFFNSKTFDGSKNFLGNTNIIYAANVICHIPNLEALIDSIDAFLSKKGIFVFEEPYLGSMFEQISYDQIYDEHVYIFSVSSIKKIFEKFNFDLFHLEKQITHGGSMRYYISRKGEREILQSVDDYILEEKKKKIDVIESCLKFKSDCEISKTNLLKNLKEFKNNSKKICGYAATSKSTTILNFCNIGPDLIECIYDTTPEKIGKYSPGMHIPIVDYEKFKLNYPDIAYLFAWNHKQEIFDKEKEFEKNGGKWFSHVKV